jgi:hypothetical protein
MAVGVGRVLRFGATLTDNDAVAICELRPRIPVEPSLYFNLAPKDNSYPSPTIVGMGKQIPANISLAY